MSENTITNNYGSPYQCLLLLWHRESNFNIAKSHKMKVKHKFYLSCNINTRTRCAIYT